MSHGEARNELKLSPMGEARERIIEATEEFMFQDSLEGRRYLEPGDMRGLFDYYEAQLKSQGFKIVEMTDEERIAARQEEDDEIVARANAREGNVFQLTPGQERTLRLAAEDAEAGGLRE